MSGTGKKTKTRSPLAALFAAALAALVLAGCHPKPVTPLDRGRIVYMTKCVECHNRDPNLAGVKGPPIAGSSEELIEARALRLSYPPGYKPKRTTHQMRKMPNLKPEIPNLALFLQAAQKKSDDHKP